MDGQTRQGNKFSNKHLVTSQIKKMDHKCRTPCNDIDIKQKDAYNCKYISS